MLHVLELHTPNYTVVHRLHAPLHLVSESCSYVEIPGIRSPHAAVLLPPHIWEHLPGVTHTDPPWSHHHAVWHTGGTSALPHAPIATQAGAHPFHNNIRHAISFA